MKYLLVHPDAVGLTPIISRRRRFVNRILGVLGFSWYVETFTGRHHYYR